MEILGDPHLSIVAYGSDEVDVFRVAEVMQAKGWLPGLVQQPKAIHRMMSMLHAPSLDAYLDDVRAAVGVVAPGKRWRGVDQGFVLTSGGQIGQCRTASSPPDAVRAASRSARPSRPRCVSMYATTDAELMAAARIASSGVRPSARNVASVAE